MSRFTIKKKPVIVAAPPVERSSFQKFEKAEVKVDLEEEEVANLVGRMIELGPKTYLGFVILSKDDVRRKKVADTQYLPDNVKEITEVYPSHRFSRVLEGFFYRNLLKAAAQIASNIVFSNDKGKAYTAMEGFGSLDEFGRWVVEKPRTGKTVVPISSAHAVDLQLFCASVGLAKTQTSVIIDSVSQTITRPAIVPKNRVENARLDLAVKKIFTNLLVLPEKDEVTDEDIKQAPWIWKLVYTACKDVAVPINGLSLPLTYFSLVEKSFDYAPAALNVDDLFYTNYDNIMKELIDQLSNHSVYCGGYFVNKYTFFNEGIRYTKCKKIGGALPVKWCSYNTSKKIIWEREGAIIEGGNLGTSVQPVRNVSEFDGIFYDPASCVNQLKNAVGLIVPYDRNGDGITAVEQWIKLRVGSKKLSEVKFKMWASFGPAPLLWIEEMIDQKSRSLSVAAPYKRPAIDILWKVMGTMPLYNFSCSLNRLAAVDAAYASTKPGSTPDVDSIVQEWLSLGVPTDPILVSVFDPSASVSRTYETEKGQIHVPVPGFMHATMSRDFIPGRHRIDSAFIRKKAVNLQGAWDGYESFSQAHSTDRRPNYSPNKRPKHGDADETFATPEAPAPAYDPTATGYGDFSTGGDDESSHTEVVEESSNDGKEDMAVEQDF